MQPLFSGQLYVAGHIGGVNSVGGVTGAASIIAAPTTFALDLVSADYLNFLVGKCHTLLGRPLVFASCSSFLQRS
jgi:hypothetical protein